MEPSVTVLLTVYNGLPYVIEAVDSVLSQDFADFEVVVVDDGSTDGTPDVLTRATDPRLRLLRRAHEGRVPALNAGLSAARGRYVANLDADDVMLPGRLARTVTFLDAHPDVAAVGSAWEPYVGAAAHRPPRRLPVTDRAIRWAFLRRNPMFNSSVTYRTAALRTVGGFSMGYARRMHDADVLLRLGRRFRLANLDTPLSARRLHAGQHFAAVDRRERAWVHARCRLRAARELGFRWHERPVAYAVAGGTAAASLVAMGVLGRNGRIDRSRLTLDPLQSTQTAGRPR